MNPDPLAPRHAGRIFVDAVVLLSAAVSMACGTGSWSGELPHCGRGASTFAPWLDPVALVWTGDGNEPRTYLLGQHEAAACIIGEVTALLIAVDDVVKELRTATVTTSVVDCACSPLAGFQLDVDETCARLADVEAPFLARWDGEGGVTGSPVLGSAPWTRGSRAGERRSEFVLRHSFADLLVGDVCTYETACGAAHGSHRCRQAAWDAKRCVEVELFSSDELKYVHRWPRFVAQRLFMLDASFGDESGDTAFEAARFSWSAWSSLETDAMFSAATSYAESDEWAAYRKTTTVPLPVPPEAIARPPAWVGDAMSQLVAGHARFGWSICEPRTAAGYG